MSKSLFYPDLLINQMSWVAAWLKKTRKLQWSQAEYKPTVSSHHNPGKPYTGQQEDGQQTKESCYSSLLSASEAAPEILGPILSSVVQEECGETGESPVDDY